MADRALKIAVLDGYGVNPGDLPWTPIEAMGTLSVFSRYDPEDPAIVAASRTADVVLADHVTFDRETFDRFPRLRYLGLFATGFDRVDLAEARARTIAVANVPGYSADSVAQLAISLLLSLAHRVPDYERLVRAGGWQPGTPFRYASRMPIELSGKTLGVLGFGAIGGVVARTAAALGMRVRGWDKRPRTVPGVPVERVSWDRLLSESDAITLHVPLTDETRRLIDRNAVVAMKPGSFLINTSRGGLIDEHAVAEALHTGHLGGAGLDVLGDREPPDRDNPLLSAPNCIVTPHIGWATREARSRCLGEVAENLAAFSAGRRRNRID